MTYFDPTLPYPDAFFDAVARQTDRVTSDPGTQQIADQVNARGLAGELDRQAAHRANIAFASRRHGRDGDSVPGVVGRLCDESTVCHLATSRNPAF
jgi:hypothetical protein